MTLTIYAIGYCVAMVVLTKYGNGSYIYQDGARLTFKGIYAVIGLFWPVWPILLAAMLIANLFNYFLNSIETEHDIPYEDLYAVMDKLEREVVDIEKVKE
jgi:hypothetical protein